MIDLTQEDLSAYYDITNRIAKKLENVAEELGKITDIEYKSFKIDVSSLTVTYKLVIKENKDIIESKIMIPGEALLNTDSWLEKERTKHQAMKAKIETWWKDKEYI